MPGKTPLRKRIEVSRWQTHQYDKAKKIVRETGDIVTALRCAKIPQQAGMAYLAYGEKERNAYFYGTTDTLTEAAQFFLDIETAQGEFVREQLNALYSGEMDPKLAPYILRMLEKTQPHLAPKVAPKSPQVVVRNENVQQNAVLTKPEVPKELKATSKVTYKPVILDGQAFEDRILPEPEEQTFETKFLPAAKVEIAEVEDLSNE